MNWLSKVTLVKDGIFIFIKYFDFVGVIAEKFETAIF